MHFCQQRTLHRDPELNLNGVAIPVTDEVKFLGLTFDRNLSFIPHIQKLKQRCLNSINLLRVVAHTDWGADSVTLLRLYRSHVRSELDYGYVVCGSARPLCLASLDRVQNAELRVCLGAFRTLPIPSLLVEAGKMPLSLRREKLCLQYVMKLKSNPNNPAYNCVFNPDFKIHFQSQPQVIPTLERGHVETVTVCSDSSNIEVCNHAVQKFNENFDGRAEYELVFKDGRPADVIPGTREPFAVKRYKTAKNVPYSKIKLFICAKEDSFSGW